MTGKNIQVAIKVRPVLKREREAKLTSYWKTINNSIQSTDNSSSFCFDHIFDENDSNEIIFDKIAKPIVDATLKGFNGTIFAYGQTSSGKTYTMLGDEKNPGVMCLAAKEIFQEIVNASDKLFLLRVGYIEIYNEKIYDLLNKSNQDLKIHETPTGDVVVNCTEFIIRSEDEMMDYLHAGSKLRKCGETNMNERSSRSHAIFRLTIESRDMDKINDDGAIQISNLNLVDLAGSERADQTGATGSRLIEGGHINRSLLSLSCVIKRLSENISDQYINYRDSKLTRILQASLGGNALTAIVCAINPTAMEETNSTLNFAMRAKTIKNKPCVNEILTDAAMMKRLEKEISRLKSALEVEKHKNSKIKVLELENQIKEENLKIVNCHSIGKSKKGSRRRTWHVQTIPEDEVIQQESSELIKEIYDSKKKEKQESKINKKCFFFTPQLITVRTEQTNDDFSRDFDMKFDENLDNTSIPSLVTPQSLKLKTSDPNGANISPNFFNIEYSNIEKEFEELRDFTNLEKMLKIDFDPVKSLKERLDTAYEEISTYKEGKLKIMNELHEKEMLEDLHIKCNELQEIDEKVKTLEETNLVLKNDIILLQEKNSEFQMQANILIGNEIEYEQSEKKLKLRVEELLYRIEQTELENKNLNYRIGNMQALNSSFTECKKCLNVKDIIIDLERSLQIKADELKNFNKLLHNSEEKRIKSQAEYDKLSTQLVEAIEECDELKSIIEQSRINYCDDINQIKIANENEKEYYNYNLYEINKQFVGNFSEINENNSILKQTIYLFQEQNNKYLNQIKVLNHKILLNDKLLQNLQNQDIQNKTINIKLSNDLMNLKKLVKILQNELGGLTNSFDSNKSLESEEKTDESQKLRCNDVQYSKEMLTLRTSNRELQNKLDDLQAKFNETQNELSLTQNDLTATGEKYSELQLLYANIENNNKLLNENHSKIEKSCSDHIKKNLILEKENKELQETFVNLQSKYNDTQNALSLKQNDFSEIGEKFSKLQLLYTGIEDDNKLLKESYAKTEKSCLDHIEKNSILKEINTQLQYKLDNLQSILNDTQKELHLKQNDLTAIGKQYSELQLLHADIENNNKLLKESHSKIEKSCSDHIKKNLILEKENKELQNTFVNLQSKYNDTQNGLSLKQNDLSEIGEKFSKLQLLYTSIEDDNKVLKESYAKIEKSYSDHIEKNSVLEEINTQLQNKLDDLQAKFNETQNELSLTQNDLTATGEKYSELQLLYANIENDNKLLNESHSKMEKSCSDHIKKNLILEKENKELQETFVNLQSKYNDTQNALSLKQNDLNEIGEKFSKLQLLYTGIEDDNKVLKESHSKIEKTCSEHIEKNSVLKEINKQLQYKLDNLQSIFNDTQNELSLKQNDLSAIGKKYSELQLLHADIENNNKLLKESHSKIEKSCSDHIKKNLILEKENKELQNKFANLQSKYNDTQNELSLKQKDLSAIDEKYSELQLLSVNIENSKKVWEENNKKNVNTVTEKYDRKINELEAIIKKLEHTLELKTKCSAKYQLEIKNLNCVLEEKNSEINRVKSHYLEATKRKLEEDESTESLFNTRDVAILTDPTDKLCRCDQLNEKILSLQKTIIIHKSHLCTLKMELEHNPFTEEINLLKKKIVDDYNEKEKLQEKYLKLQRSINEKSSNLQAKYCQTDFNNSKSISSQTDSSEGILNEPQCDLKQENLKLISKCHKLTSLCNYRSDELKKLQNKFLGKENQSQNSNQIIDLKDFNALKAKYDDAKQIAIIRGRKIDELKGIIENLQISQISS